MSTYNRVVAADETASLAPAVRARLATELSDSSTEVGAALNTAYVGAVMPEAFGAIGDGVTDDTTAVQNAINSLSISGGSVVLSRRYKIATVTIATQGIRITGPGVIVDGTVAIGTDGTAPPYARLDARIDTVSFYRSGTSTSVNAITAARCLGIQIDDVNFTGYNAAFYVRPQTFSGTDTHHVARVRMSRVKTTDCQFVLRTTKFTSGVGLLACADIEISDSEELAVLDSHAFCEGIDGLRLTNLTLFMPGYTAASTTKRWNVRVDGGTHIELTGVHCFEAGLEGIYLSKVQSFGFANVEVWAPGQRVRSAGVRIDDGDTAGAEYCFGNLGGARVVFPTLHGVWIQGASGHITAPNVTVRSPGASTYYYGAVDATVAEYFLAEATTKYITVGSASEFTGGVGTPRVIARGANSHGRTGAAHSTFWPATLTPAGEVNWSTDDYASTYPFGVRSISAASQNDNRTYYADLAPGIYTVDLWHNKSTDRGVYSVRFNGVEIGTIDGYAAASAVAKNSVTTITVPTGGRTAVALVMATKNASSSGYRGVVHGLALQRISGF